jgi:hypothetical protein
MMHYELYDDDPNDELTWDEQILLRHRDELYEKVKEARRQTKQGTFRYPERLNWWEQAHPEHLGPEYEFIRRFDRNVKHGIRVVTKVEWLSPIEEIEYQPKVINRWGKEEDAPWYKTLSSSPGSVPENPLLAITVKPVLGDVMPYARYRIPGEHWHASVAFYWELGPRIYDKDNLMEHLIRKFHNKMHTLYHTPTDSGWQKWKDEKTGEDQEGQATVISLDPNRDPIASDLWLRAAKAKGRYYDRDWHISL